ncbi:MAG: hypothetical protein JWP27_2685 [Flaviaesturariibacter sp.]|nr:hypothetical protein [Flaviaesturariibacter sp.]
MKKILFMTVFLAAILSATSYAQSADQAAMLQQAKEKQKSQMVEKTGLTEAQADRVIEINFEMREAARALRDLSDADRSARIAELKAAKEKKYSEIPLTAEQIKAVYDFYENMGKPTAHKSGN